MQYAERNGWKLYLHPAFQQPFDSLTQDVTKLKDSRPESFQEHPKAKLLKRITELILEEIPRDPAGRQYELGKYLGTDHRHWRRAKFLGRFRLFLRYHSSSRTIIYAWVNDGKTQRKAGAKTDPYSVFKQRLLRGDPPDDWEILQTEAVAGVPQSPTRGTKTPAPSPRSPPPPGRRRRGQKTAPPHL